MNGLPKLPLIQLIDTFTPKLIPRNSHWNQYRIIFTHSFQFEIEIATSC